MSVTFTFRAIDSWPGQRTHSRRPSKFKASYSQTLDLLERELHHLGARNVIVEADCAPSEVRLDGQLRANARLNGPGIILSFDSRFGPLRYPCDTFTHWQDNLRAIALALEALRKVDRYGVTKRGEQYTGWAKLPPGGAITVAMTTERAARFLADSVGSMYSAAEIMQSPNVYGLLYRVAAKKLHPDVGGSTADFQTLQEAKRVLDRHHGVRP